MIDKSIPLYWITMCKTDTKNYPRYQLPDGYTFSFYRKGDEYEWAKLEHSLGQTESIEKGLTCFENQFVKGQTLNLYHRMLFVRNRMGEVVATASLWNGDFCGTECQRVHWVAVRDDCSGKGIAKALLTRILDLYNQLGFEGFIYLETGTRYYPAIGLYRKFGFTEYTGEISLDPKLSNEEYAKQNQIALDIINTKLNSYHNKK